MIILICGQPSSGKTTLAKKLAAAISDEKMASIVHLDGDVWREMTNNKDYSFSGRVKNLLSAFGVAKHLSQNSHVVLSFVAPYQSARDSLKDCDGFVQIYLTCDVDRGRSQNFVSDFEPPTEDVLHIDTFKMNEAQTVDMALAYIYQKIYNTWDKKYHAKSSMVQNDSQWTMFIGRWQPLHDGHKQMFQQVLDAGGRVCIAVREVQQSESNPYSTESVISDIQDQYKGNSNVMVMSVPDISAVAFGRGVGYDVIEFVPPKEVAEISATKIREKIKHGV